MGIEQIKTDVLVIGGGAAALRAAIAAHDAEARVVVAVKGRLGECGATVSQDSQGVAWQCADECSGSDDSPEVHYQNIIDVGLGLADPRLAQILAYEIAERTAELESWGLNFSPDTTGKKKHFTAYSCFGDQPRSHTVPNTGYGHAGDVLQVLARQAQARGIAIHEGVFVSDLLVQDEVCVGAMALSPTGDPLVYQSGSVVIGAGGARQIFPSTATDRIDTTGDGYAMALRAGAALTNMEFVQYMLLPQGFSLSDIPGIYWGACPALRNRHGEEVLTRYLPPGTTAEQSMHDRCLHMPFSCRDASGWIDVAVVTEENAGRGAPEGGLYLDFSAVDLDRFKPVRQHHFDENMDRKVIIPSGSPRVVSSAHASNGGVLIDRRGESSLPGLFAAGEACAGPHGADRLGGGMVSMCVVFGAKAGEFAAAHALKRGESRLWDNTLQSAQARVAPGKGQRGSETLFSEVQDLMGRNFLVVKNAATIQKALDGLEKLRREWLPDLVRDDAGSIRRAVEAENSLTVAELMTRAALMRQESRGSHFRKDYPEQDDAGWRRNIILQLEDGELQLNTRTL